MKTTQIMFNMASASFKWIASVALMASLLTACQQPTEEIVPEGITKEVKFGVSAAYQSEERVRSAEIATRTEYSGLDENGQTVSSTSTAERISWLSTDKVAILCGQAKYNQTADYAITPGSYDNARHNASVEPLGDALVWNAPGGGMHYFYGVYPSAAMEGAPSDLTYALAAGSDGKEVTISASIPAAQTVTVSSSEGLKELKPDMSYAYMYAHAKSVLSNEVALHFKPLVTTLRFTLKKPDEVPAGLKLSQIKLSSSQSTLCGSFTASVGESGLVPLTSQDITGGGNTITIAVPDGGVALSTSDVLMFTVLTLPVEQTAMKLNLVFSDGSSRVLALKSGAEDITVQACKKCYISDIDLPWVYTLDVTSDVTADYLGKNTDYRVTSYKTIGSTGTAKLPVEWAVTGYSTDGGTSWVTEKPDWLSNFTEGGVPASGDAQAYDLTIAPQNRHGAEIDALKNAPSKSENPAQPFDLSKYNPLTNEITATRTTANSYVISAPGYYWFPAVYGNGLNLGGTNEAAYYNNKTSHNPSSGRNPEYFTDNYDHYLKRFKNHNDADVTSPYIAQNSITLQSASLVWQDSQDLVSDISMFTLDGIAGVRFRIEQETIFEGNAVIGVLDDQGKIAWSWHIWVTPHSMAPVTVKGKQFMEYNLGWCDDLEFTWAAREVKVKYSQPDCPSNEKILTFTQTSHSQMLYGSGPHWQWGRKDPMLPPLGDPNMTGDRANKVWYGPSGVASQRTPMMKGTTTIGYAIQHPMEMIWIDRDYLHHRFRSFDNFIMLDSPYSDWTGYINPNATMGNSGDEGKLSTNYNEHESHYCNLWNYNSEINSDLAGRARVYENLQHGKTIYDPCPVGYTVPVPEDVIPLATEDWQGYLRAYTLESVHYDAYPGIAYPPTSGSQNPPVFNRGFTIDGNFWPAAGARLYLSSNQYVADFGNSSVYFTSATRTSHVVYGLHLDSNYAVKYDGHNYKNLKGLTVTGVWAKASARPIRCVPDPDYTGGGSTSASSESITPGSEIPGN